MDVDVRSLGKSYGGRRVVDDVSFQLAAGQITGFLGPNGAGKTTVLRLMLGLARGTGVTLYGGVPLRAHRDVPGVVGAHLDVRAWHPKRRARHHLEMLAAGAGVSRRRVAEVIAQVGLEDVQDERVCAFSLGMTQRLGLAAAIMSSPQVLIVDEPTNGLDAQAISWLRDFLRTYARLGNVVFVASHMLAEMEQLSDRVIVIAQGQVVVEEEVTRLLTRSRDTHVTVRSNDDARLGVALTAAGLTVEAGATGGLTVHTDNTSEVGLVAHGAGLRIDELTLQTPTLESVFLGLTGQRQGYALPAVDGAV